MVSPPPSAGGRRTAEATRRPGRVPAAIPGTQSPLARRWSCTTENAPKLIRRSEFGERDHGSVVFRPDCSTGPAYNSGMKIKLLAAAIATLSLVGGVFAFRAVTERADCPGKITCPLTSEVICADQCPLSSDAQAQAEVPDCCKAKTAAKP